MARLDYKKTRDLAQKRYRRIASEGRDIGPPPPIADPARRSACEGDLALFCRTYFASWFWLPWGSDHLAVLGRAQDIILNGGKAAIAMPRGSGKTSLLLCAAMWAVLYQHRRFVLLLGASEYAARSLLQIILNELETNKQLADDFPAAIHPIQALEGVRHRAAAQLANGQRTFVHVGSNNVTLPLSGGGGTIRTTSIAGRLRGFLVANPANSQLMRPDLVLLDDIETDRTAMSRIQTHRLWRQLSQGVLGMAGPGAATATFILGTVISSTSLLAQVLAKPDWHPVRCSLMPAMPRNMELWRRYYDIRTQHLRAGLGTGMASLFYLVNHHQMTDGAAASWPDRYDSGEIDAIEHGMLKYFEDQATFWAEYQNQPEVYEQQQEQERMVITPAKLARRLSGKDRGVAPAHTTLLTAHIDIQKRILYYIVMAWDAQFSGSVIAYGTWPEQNVGQFEAASPPSPIQDFTDADTIEGQIRAALRRLLDQLLAWRFVRDGSNETLQISSIGIDAAWGLIRQALDIEVHDYPHKAFIKLMQGRVVSGKSRSFAHARPKPGDRLGHEWMLTSGATRGRLNPFVLYDTNVWKSIVADKLCRASTDPGAITIYGDTGTNHALFFTHLCSEHRDDDGQWILRLRQTENHWWDAMVGATVLANVSGLAMDDAKPAKKRVSFARMQSENRHAATGP